jgi:hypothetical protein
VRVLLTEKSFEIALVDYRTFNDSQGGTRAPKPTSASVGVVVSGTLDLSFTGADLLYFCATGVINCDAPSTLFSIRHDAFDGGHGGGSGHRFGLRDDGPAGRWA